MNRSRRIGIWSLGFGLALTLAYLALASVPIDLGVSRCEVRTVEIDGERFAHIDVSPYSSMSSSSAVHIQYDSDRGEAHVSCIGTILAIGKTGHFPGRLLFDLPNLRLRTTHRTLRYYAVINDKKTLVGIIELGDRD